MKPANPTLRWLLGLLWTFVFCPQSVRAQEHVIPDEVGRTSMLIAQQVAPKLLVPTTVLIDYSVLLEQALAAAGTVIAQPQFLILVDRSPQVQATILLWGATAQGWRLLGAVPVSTSLPGKYEHFLTPLGVFAHSTENPDFRADCTKNKLSFRGYGSKGMRIYDMGWVRP